MERVRGGKRTERGPGFVEINFRIAFVGRNDEPVSVGAIEQEPPPVTIEDASGRIIGRAHVDELRAFPHSVGHIAPAMRKATIGIGVDAMRFGARKQRCALVDLIERIRHDHRGSWPTAIDDRLRKRKKCLATPEHRQHLRRRIERSKAVPRA